MSSEVKVPVSAQEIKDLRVIVRTQDPDEDLHARGPLAIGFARTILAYDAALTERDRQWREKVEGLVQKLIDDAERERQKSEKEHQDGLTHLAAVKKGRANGYETAVGRLQYLLDTRPYQGDKRMSEFRKYRRTNIAEMRPYVRGEDMAGISVSGVDDPPNDMGMVARNPQNHDDQWYVARKYFEDNFEATGE